MDATRRKGSDFIALDRLKQKQHSIKVKKIKEKEVKEVELTQDKPGVIYLAHIPHGFFEPQMKAYFEQFGDVNKVRLSRSKKSGRSKGYAYIEFASKLVATVAAETMNNYLMFEKRLKCEVLKEEQVHPDLFKGHDSKFRPMSRKKALASYNLRSDDAEKVAKRVKRAKNRENKTEKKLKELGIEFDFTKVSTKPDWTPPSRKLAVTGVKQKRRKVVVPDIWEADPPAPPLDVTAEMVVDADDNEINFKTPPKKSKITKKSLPADNKEKAESHENAESNAETESHENAETESHENAETKEKAETESCEKTDKSGDDVRMTQNKKLPKSAKKTERTIRKSLSRKRKLLSLTM